MRQTAREIMDQHNIVANAMREGNQVTRCPQCSHTRKKKRVPCLSVKIDSVGLQYHCHHCGWAGGEFFDMARRGERYQTVPAVPPAQRERDVRRLYR